MSIPAVAAKVAGENANYAEQWANVAEDYQALNERVSAVAAKLNTTKSDLDDVRSKLEHYGLTPTVGLLLRHKKEQLDAWQGNGSVTLFVTEELGRARQKQLEVEMVRYNGADASGQTTEILAEAGLDAASVQSMVLASQVRALLDQRREWLAALQQGYHDYQRKLAELDSTTTELAKLTREYRTLIDRHVTWIRSGDPIRIDDLRNLGAGLGALFDFRRSSDLGYSIKRKWQANAIAGIGLLVSIVLFLLMRWRTKSWLVDIGSRKRMREATADTRKLAAGVLTTFVALAFPGVLYVLARWLGTGVVSESTLHASSGLYAASLVALMVEVPRQLLRKHGYMEKHVAVELPHRERATAFLTLVGFGLVWAAYVITLMNLVEHGMWRDSVSRFGLMAAMLMVALTAHLTFRPTGGFLEPWIAKFGGSVIHRVRFIIYLAGIGFPLAMLVLAALGYGYTSTELIRRAIITLVSVMVAATLWSGVKIVSANIWQMLTGTMPSPQYDEYGRINTGSSSGSQVSGVLGEHFLELKHHLAFLCQCGLVVGAIVAFGSLWIDVFPNVRMGNPVVWTVQDTVTQSSVDASGQTITSSVMESTPVTALHLLLAAATLFVAFQLAKLLPALFDALVLQRVSFDEGMEHFFLVLGRVLLFGVGCLVACKWVGVRWQTIQWLAVGLTIGLGFGLQDMVRNLFGGLVVLFEKPARLGDLITVGRVTGRVAAQKFRTTVLSDDEGREVIIPNKNFVSEDVVNWMGAGRLNVIPIEVAVSRDERPADLCRTLQELVIAQPDVLLAPAPQATLVCVGQASQRIEVRAWIEEGQDPARFRDGLLKIVSKFLREHELLAAVQPTQPLMREATEDEMLSGNFRSRSSRTRKRSA
ncbi:Mechanosensitive channel MscK precursor [Novipirellula galeiformis]|uniref:Mechanosensitive channel MscK n=1 Tax=Novipirellula galeiformis TaxID=2528004 RepID=A0A5C6C8E7_9BACT|nr:mechanosensitive ion channel domain-containing protein [Novipirellula galeiformis]TWU20307.1 Mechanosensitive channel MscK precursor [Novipirellula galeiformis]